MFFPVPVINIIMKYHSIIENGFTVSVINRNIENVCYSICDQYLNIIINRNIKYH